MWILRQLVASVIIIKTCQFPALCCFPARSDEDDNVACDSDFNNNDCDDDESITCDRDII